MAQENLFQSLPILAHAIGQKCGVKVVLGGNSAHTNGETIYLPSPKGFDRDVLLGYLIHEAAHVRFSNFDLLKVRVTPAVAHLRNVYEDTRIERKMAGVYRGANALLRQTMKYVFAKEKVPKEMIPIIFGFIAMDCWDRYRMSGDIFTQHAKKFRKAALKFFPVSLLDEFSKINDRILLAQSDKDCQTMAEDVMVLLQQYFQDNPQMIPVQQMSESSDEPSELNQSNQGQASESSNSSNDDQSQTKLTEKSSSSKADTEDSEQSGQASGSPESNDQKDTTQVLQELNTFEDKSKDLSQVLKEELESKGSENIYVEGSHSASTTTEFLLDPVKAEQLIAKAQQIGNGLSRQLQGLVSQATRTHRKTAMSGQKLSRTKLARLGLFNPRVFERRTEHTSTASAVHILLDLSCSMNNRCKTASAAALSLWMALKRLPFTNPALTLFPYTSYSRVVLNHGEQLIPSRRAQLSDLLNTYGDTPLYEALQDVVQLLALTKEKRKIVIVITDGCPSNSYLAENYISRMIASGIEVFGIGIGYSIKHLMKNSVVINDVNELSSALFALARQTSLLTIE